jgi:NAD(P)-dependent dehydrogenase (short-subunit alcohol dehydrogenase family)
VSGTPESDDTGRRTIVLTGASSGIGAVAAEQLSALGNEVAVVGRNPERTRAVANRVGATPFLADFERLDDVRALAEALLDRYETIDVLANNAGGLNHVRELTVDGYERTIQNNLLAPFLLTHLLRPRLEATAAAGRDVRVINTASLANRFGRLRLEDLDWEHRPWRGGWPAYGTAKLATILFTVELAERLTGTGVTAYSFHPGTIATNFGRTSPLIRFGALVTRGTYGIPVAEGATPLIRLAAETPVLAPSGTYFDRLKANGATTAQAKDAQLGRDLWAVSEQLVGVSETV